MRLLFTMDPIINFFSLSVGMSASLAGLPVIIKAEQLDIIFLQEVRVTSDQIEHLLRGFRAVVNIDEAQPAKPGTAIVSSCSGRKLSSLGKITKILLIGGTCWQNPK